MHNRWAAARQNQQNDVWSQSSLSAWRNLGSFATHWAHCEDSDQTGRIPRLIWVFVQRTWHLFGIVVRRLRLHYYHHHYYYHHLCYPLSAQRRLWSDCADAQADLSLCWAQMSFCWFCCAADQDTLLLLLLLLLVLLLLKSNASIIAISTCQEITSDFTLQQICYLHISLPW